MKRYFTPIILIVGVLVGLWYFYDESANTLRKAKLGYETAQLDVDTASQQREMSSNQIVALNRSVKDSVEFLAAWRNYYTNNRDYEAPMNKLAERAKCAVVGRKWDAKKVNLGRLEYNADSFTGMVVGDYRDIVKFIGDMEANMQLSTVWSLEFKQGVNEVNCATVVYFPNLPFMTGGSQ